MEIMQVPISNRLIFSITLTDIILLITFFAICWYSWETRKMRKEIVNQRIIQSTPFLSIFIQDYSIKIGGSLSPGILQRKFCIRNDGEGTARNVEIKGSSSITSMPIFRIIDVLPKGVEEELTIEKPPTSDAENKFTITEFLSRMITLSEVEELPFELNYRNILNEPYQTKVVFRDKQFLIKEFFKLT